MSKHRISRADISDAQRTAARLLVLHPEWSKDRIAEAAGVGRTALYGWLRDARFQELVEHQTAQSPVAPQDIVNRLDDDSKRELLARLESAERSQNDRITGIAEHIDRLRRRLEVASEPRRSVIASEIEKLIGRLALMREPYAETRYYRDGSLKPPSAEGYWALAQDLVELAILEKALAGTDLEEAMMPARLAYTMATAMSLGLTAAELSDEAR